MHPSLKFTVEKEANHQLALREVRNLLDALPRPCYFSVAVRVIFWTHTAFVSMLKDVQPPHHINSVIYKYPWSCGSDYIGRTSNRLDLRIKQYLLTHILNLELKRGQLVNTSGSSITDIYMICKGSKGKHYLFKDNGCIYQYKQGGHRKGLQ